MKKKLHHSSSLDRMPEPTNHNRPSDRSLGRWTRSRPESDGAVAFPKVDGVQKKWRENEKKKRPSSKKNNAEAPFETHVFFKEPVWLFFWGNYCLPQKSQNQQPLPNPFL